MARLGTTKLVNSDEPLYVPITQEPVPKTEDQLEDDAEVMLRLGPGSGKYYKLFRYVEFFFQFSRRITGANDERIITFGYGKL